MTRRQFIAAAVRNECDSNQSKYGGLGEPRDEVPDRRDRVPPPLFLRPLGSVRKAETGLSPVFKPLRLGICSTRVIFLPAAKPTGLGEHFTPSSVISSLVALWLRLGHVTSSGKVDSNGKSDSHRKK